MTAGEAQRTTPVPRDGTMPQLRTLLDPSLMGDILGRLLANAEPVHVEIPYLRYKPADSLAVHYRVELPRGVYDAVAVSSAADDLAGEPYTPAHRARAALVGARSPSRAPIVYEPDLRALVYWLPFDIDLPALAEPPGSLRGRIADAGAVLDRDGGEAAVLQYRPRRRVALRLDDSVVKVYRNRKTYEAGVAGLDWAARQSSLRTARGTACVPEWLLTVQELLPGEPLLQRAAVAQEAGTLLSAFHGSGSAGLPAFLPRDRLRQIAQAVAVVSAIAPSLAARAQRLLRELEVTAPEPDELVPSHGDFHGGQLLKHDGGLALIDLDLLCLAAPALDLANYAGHLVPREAHDADAAATVLEGLVEGYGRRPAGLSWYLGASILRRARVPFRNFEPDWPAGTERMIAAAEAAFRL